MRKIRVVQFSIVFVTILFVLVLDTICQVNGNKNRNNDIQKYINKVNYYIKKDSVPELINAYNNLTTLYIDNSELDKAFECCQKILVISGKYKITVNGKCYYDLGRVYSDWGIYDSSVINYNKSLEIAKRQGKKELEADILNNIGYIHRLWGNYDLALEAFKNTLEIDRQFSDSTLIASDLNNIAHAYVFKKDFTHAIDYYNQSLAISAPKNYIYEMGLANSGLGSVYLKLGNLDKAESLIRKATEFFIQSEQSAYLPGIYLKLGDIFFKQHINDSAVHYINKAYRLASSFKDAENKMEALKLFSELYFKTGDYIKANTYKEQYTLLKDSLFTIQKHKQLADFQNKYNLKKFEEELAASKNEKRIILSHQKIWVIAFLSIVLLLVCAITWLIRRYLHAKKLLVFLRKQKKEIEEKLSIIIANKELNDTNPGWKPSDETIAETFQEISYFLKKTKIYLNDDLTLPLLAQNCGFQVHHISKAINTITNSNFNDLINSYRIEEAKLRLNNPEFAHFTIDAVGQSVGFKSRTSFIGAFKKFESVTPSEFKKKIKTEVLLTS